MPEDRVADDNDLDEASARLQVVVGRLVRLLRRCGPTELGPGSLSALATLTRCGPTRLGDLATREGISPPTLTRIVAFLEDGGYLAREVDPKDRRAVRVVATPAGQAAVRGVLTLRAQALRDRVLALEEADRAAIVAALPALEALVARDT